MMEPIIAIERSPKGRWRTRAEWIERHYELVGLERSIQRATERQEHDPDDARCKRRARRIRRMVRRRAALLAMGISLELPLARWREVIRSEVAANGA